MKIRAHHAQSFGSLAFTKSLDRGTHEGNRTPIVAPRNGKMAQGQRTGIYFV